MVEGWIQRFRTLKSPIGGRIEQSDPCAIVGSVGWPGLKRKDANKEPNLVAGLGNDPLGEVTLWTEINDVTRTDPSWNRQNLKPIIWDQKKVAQMKFAKTIKEIEETPNRGITKPWLDLLLILRKRKLALRNCNPIEQLKVLSNKNCLSFRMVRTRGWIRTF